MPSIGSFIGKFFGRTASEAAGVAAGITVARPLAPLAQNVENEFWAAAVALGFSRPLDVAQSAEIVAQRIWDLANGQNEAAVKGISKADFNSLVAATLTAPGTAEALELWRRGRIGPDDMKHALHKAGLEDRWIKPVLELFGERLDPAEIANAIQQGFLKNNGVLPAPTPPQPGWVKTDGPFPIPVEQVQLTDTDNKAVTPEQEAAASGISFERLQVEAELSGNPPGEETLLDMWRRGILNATGYATGLREGRTKTKWTAALSARFWALLPPTVLVNLRLRGWIEDPAYHERMALHGYRPEQAQDWYDSSGRPATTHQALVGTRRGGIYDGPLDGIPDYFVKAVRQSNIKPEWTHILFHGRETFPSAFVLRALTTRGDITQTQAHDLLYQNGWPEWLATTVSQAWSGGTTSTTAPLTKSAVTQAVTEIRAAYLIGQADETQARGWLTAIGVAAGEQDGMLPIWDVMKQVPQKGLTAAQIKKAYRDLPSKYPLTWATAELLKLGYTNEDVAALLEL